MEKLATEGQWERLIRGRAIQAPITIWPIPLWPEADVARWLQNTKCSPAGGHFASLAFAAPVGVRLPLRHMATQNRLLVDVLPAIDCRRGLRGITWVDRELIPLVNAASIDRTMAAEFAALKTRLNAIGGSGSCLKGTLPRISAARPFHRGQQQITAIEVT